MKFNKLLIVLVLIPLVFGIFSYGTKKTDTQAEHYGLYVADSAIYSNINRLYQASMAEDLKERFSSLNRRGVFNGTILYAEHGEVVFKDVFGYADFRKKESLKIGDAFQLASVSKMFTAYAIMLLHQEGMLEYDDTITRFIPEFPYPEVTIRQLLNHRSGLSRYMSLADKFWDVNKPINNEQVIELFVKYKPAPYFRPDDGFHYCNTNYALLASVVERISGMFFDEFLQQHVFEPLGMNDSFVYNLRGDSVIYRAVPVGVSGYYVRGRRIRTVGDYYLNGVMGDKGVYSTVEDMFKFNTALDEGALVSLTELEEGFKKGSPDYYRRKDNYGFGWRIKDDMDSTAYHFGWWKGFRSYFVRDMHNERTLIVLTNTHSGTSSSVFWDIIEDADRPRKLREIYSSIH